jgi:hypothetical protein
MGKDYYKILVSQTAATRAKTVGCTQTLSMRGMQ